MFRRAFCFFLLVFAFGLLPAAAQDTESAADFVPADFAGFVRLQVDDPNLTLYHINVATFALAQLQPGRAPTTADVLPYDAVIPFPELFDMDEANFVSAILPWLKDEIVIAYRDFDGAFGTEAADRLLILPTFDVLLASNTLSVVLEAQDDVVQTSYRGITIYQGNNTAIALTSPAVFIGSIDLLKAALDVQAGVAESITDSPIYRSLRTSAAENPAMLAYVDADHILPAVSGLLAGTENTEPLLAAFGGALSQMRGSANFESMLLTGGFDGAIGTIEIGDIDAESYLTLEAKAVFYTTHALPAQAESQAQADLFALIPQNAMMAGQGTDARGMVYDVITALPLSNFARDLIGGLPIQTVGTDSDQITVPTADQLGAAVNSYLTALEQFGQFNLEADLLSHLSGDYVVAFMPRPNDPLPVLNTPFDTLFVAGVSDEEAALAGATVFLQQIFNLDGLETSNVDGWTLNNLGVADQPIIQLGAHDGRLLIGTGDAVETAISGDDHLVDSDAWKRFDDALPLDIYMDRSALFNVFFPQPGGAVPPSDGRVYFGLKGNNLENNLYELKLTALLPVG